MHLIRCPFCGPRAQTEFHYRMDCEGIPADWVSESAADAHRRMLYRSNEIGFHRELWRHVHGCGSWLVVERHNATHEIRGVEYAHRPRGES